MSDYFCLPQDLFVEILVRVPIQDLVKSTVVCKSWNSFIKNPTFISTHLGKTFSSTKTNLVFFSLCTLEKPSYPLRFDNKDVDEYKQLHFPRKKFRSIGTGCSCVVGTCNGLVCLIIDDSCDRNFKYILWNPVIRKAIRLPDSSVRVCRYGLPFNGFGFDSKTNDYKLLRLVDELDDNSVGAQVYSLNTNCWTSIAFFHEPYYYGKYSFVNGAIHLLARDRKGGRRRNLILAFVVSEQVFSEIPLPHHLSNASFPRAELQLLKYRQSSIVIMTREYWGLA
ncbi:hypothetical protein COLO4_36381 [Corchorus olitorius]|uniref:F-box domain-containing protein n=1 Tax=Corchorus olitorius TaxID=93759 RepID=A0A1R3G948_9ROSI|nr:hypothetical protein COLO4_36381 [Corchorus olitorius]